MLHFRRRSMASSSAPPVLPFDTSSRFFAWVHEHSASPLYVDPACTYYNGSRAVDVMGQRRHDKGVIAPAVAAALGGATVRRIDEGHANPLAAWVGMGAPDYTTAAQNAALLAASQLHQEQLLGSGGGARIGGGATGFSIAVPTHGVAAVRIVVPSPSTRREP